MSKQVVNPAGHTEPESIKLADHFRVGNIIRSDYWRDCDRVVSFHPGYNWCVVVEQVKHVDGEWVAVAPRRRHATYPSKRDVIVSHS